MQMPPGALHAAMPVLVTRASDIHGEWVARCLPLDLVTQGPSLREAFEMMREAVLIVVEDDLRHGLDPLGRARSDDGYWAQAMEILRNGQQVGDVDEARVVAAAGVMLVSVPRTALVEAVKLPPAWMLASLDSLRNSQHAG